MYCKYCGKAIPEGAKFCRSCGGKLTAAECETRLNEGKSSESKTFELREDTDQKSNKENEICVEQKKDRSKAVGVIAIIAATAIIVGGVYYFVFAKGLNLANNASTKPTNSVTNSVTNSSEVSDSKTNNSPTSNSDADNTVKTNTSEYILPDSADRYLSDSEVSSMSKDQLALARNEIFARHGYVFNSKVYSDYFSAKSWYTPNSSYKSDIDTLNIYERYNISLLQKYENQ